MGIGVRSQIATDLDRKTTKFEKLLLTTFNFEYIFLKLQILEKRLEEIYFAILLTEFDKKLYNILHKHICVESNFQPEGPT